MVRPNDGGVPDRSLIGRLRKNINSGIDRFLLTRSFVLAEKKLVIHVKRISESPSSEDGVRILVDRLWPRGIKKEKANIDLWLKDIAPSDSLRKWFNHEEEKWEEFKKRYGKELKEKQEFIDQLSQHLKNSKVTLLFSAKDEAHNNAVALREYLLAH